MGPPFDAAYVRAVYTHPFSNGLLRKGCLESVAAHVRPEDPADIHPQDRKRSRILALRIIIRGATGRFSFGGRIGFLKDAVRLSAD